MSLRIYIYKISIPKSVERVTIPIEAKIILISKYTVYELGKLELCVGNSSVVKI